MQRPIGRHGHERRAHDLADAHPGGALVLGGDLVRDVALRDDADQAAAGVEDARPSAPAVRAGSARHRARSRRRGSNRRRFGSRSRSSTVILPPSNSQAFKFQVSRSLSLGVRDLRLESLTVLLPPDLFARELLVEPRLQRREVVEDRRRVHLLRAGQRLERVGPRLRHAPSTASRSAAAPASLLS